MAHATGRGCVGLLGLNRILIFSALDVFAATIRNGVVPLGLNRREHRSLSVMLADDRSSAVLRVGVKKLDRCFAPLVLLTWDSETNHRG